MQVVKIQKIIDKNVLKIVYLSWKKYFYSMRKLNELVASMNLHEKKAFVSYLQSPYFNSDPLLENLFNEVGKRIVLQKKSESALINLTSGNGTKLKEQQLRYLQTDLSQHLEYFLTLRYLNKRPLQLNTIKLQALSERDCHKSWSHILISVQKDEIRNFDFHLSRFIASENEAGYLAGKQSRKKSPDFENVMHHLDAFYYAKKLQLFCEMINMKSLLALEQEIPFFNDIIKQSLHYLDEPAVQIYYYILLSLLEPEHESNFTHARNIISVNRNVFPAKELDELFFYIKNYCIRKINQGKQHYMLTLFDIYKEIIDNHKLSSLGYISEFEFKNIVSLSLRLNEPKWCHNFISKFISRVDPANRQNTLAYNWAYYKFRTGDFKTAIRLLQEVEFTDLVYQLDSRVILLKSYYELGDVETFFYHASAFRLFLLRNRHLSDYQKIINRQLIKHLIAIIRNRHSESKMIKVKEAIFNEKNVADVNWLKEKFEEAML